MLKSITLERFRSYARAELPLAPLTVLIGANASGKSNAIEGLRLLSWLAQGEKLSAIQQSVQSGDRVVRGKAEDLSLHGGERFTLGCTMGDSPWSELRVTIERRDDGLHIVEEEIRNPSEKVPLYRLDRPTAALGSDVGVAYNNFARGGVKPHLTCSDQRAVFTQLGSPATFPDAHKASRQHIPPVVNGYAKALASMLFLDPVPARMRDYAFPSDRVLQGDGANLSAVLYGLWGNGKPTRAHSENRREILRFIESLPEQDIRRLSFLKEPRGGVMLKLTESFGGIGRDYDASLLSDGTLRVLSIAAAMLSAPASSLVVIEEIDNGVHPSRAGHLLERIRAVAERRGLRVLLSTHNPALLDALPDAAVGDVVFCYRSPADGSSLLVRLDDLPAAPELLAQDSLGRLLTAGRLDRFVKTPRDAEARELRMQSWLAGLREKPS